MSGNFEILQFTTFGLKENLLEALDISGFYETTPIQEKAIPAVLEGKDLIGCAQTGTGKTGAFLIPIIQRLLENPQNGKHRSRCLIVVPTRELARQIYEQIEGFAYYTNISAIAVYGGSMGGDWSEQKTAIMNGVDLIVATPGRLIQHITMGYVDFSGIQFLVLDEADKMLDMGFVDDIVRIVSELPAQRQNLLFSATMPDNIRHLAKKILRDPVQINISVSQPASGVIQSVYYVNDADKINLLKSIIGSLDVKSMLIFASRKIKVDEIERSLRRMNVEVYAIHSDKTQEERERVMREFSNKQISIVIATDILSRGIDVDDISHIINYDCPHDPEDYVHRVGRTARYESTGKAITFVSAQDIPKFRRIEKMIGKEVQKEKLPAGIPEPSLSAGRNDRRSQGFYNQRNQNRGQYGRNQPGNAGRPGGKGRGKGRRGGSGGRTG